MTTAVSETLKERQERVAAGGELADLWRRLRRNRTAVVGAGVVLIFVSLAVLAPVLVPYSPIRGNLDDRLQSFSGTHLLGTDELGRDLLSRILYGARVSLQIQIVAVVLALVVGVLLDRFPATLGATWTASSCDAWTSS
jgi:peptide/nickel transport system permease protein